MVTCCVFGCTNRSSMKSKSQLSKETKQDFLSFHKFPKNPEQRKLWTARIARVNWEPTEYTTICSDHFMASDYQGFGYYKLLRPKAVPSVFTSYPKHLQKKFRIRNSPIQRPNDVAQRLSQIEDEAEYNEELSKLLKTAQPRTSSSIKCEELDQRIEMLCFLCQSTSNNTKGLTFFGFPKNVKMRKLWTTFCNLSDASNVDMLKICSRHFRPDDFIYNKAAGGVLKLKEGAKPSIRKNRDQHITFAKIEVPSNSANKPEVIEKDPLAITTDSFSLFGDSVKNIEFVVESDEEGTSKDNPIIIHVSDFPETVKQPISKQNLKKLPVIESTSSHDEVHLDLDSLNTEDIIKDEEEPEDEVIQILSDSDDAVEVSAEGETAPKQTDANNSGVKKNTRCFVPNCTIAPNEEDTLQWFKAPTDKNLRKIWDICIERSDKKLEANDVVCHQHFADSDIVFTVNSQNVIIGITLKEGAVPCIRFHEECCVPGCKNTANNMKMFCFPVLRTSNYQLWLYMIRNPILKPLKMKDALRYRVCAKHFDADCFENENTLKSTAAPTLWIPAFSEQNIIPMSAAQLLTKPSTTTRTNTQHNVIKLCCTYGDCKNTTMMGKKVFRFPVDLNTCIAWLRACKQERFISTPEMTVQSLARANLGVCEDHFELSQFLTTEKLKFDAVPNLLTSKSGTGNRTPVSFKPNSAETVKKALENVHKPFTGMCSYKACYKMPSENCTFFNFPLGIARSNKWLRACGLSDISQQAKDQIVKNERVCSAHFTPDMFLTENTLKPDAVPVQHKKGFTRKKSNEQTDNTKLISCAVPTCRQRYNESYGKGKFPDPSKDRERFNLWLKLVSNLSLDELSPEEIYAKYMVCWRHFVPQFFVKEGGVDKLRDEAVPTRRLSNDIDWFYSTDYYKTKVQSYMKPGDENETTEHDIPEIQENPEEDKEPSTLCFLEKTGIRFPKTGHFLFVDRKENCKRKFPYGVYKYFKTGYGLSNDVMFGENVNIHTAIIIDDDDACERQVLQTLLDKRRKVDQSSR